MSIEILREVDLTSEDMILVRQAMKIAGYDSFSSFAVDAVHDKSNKIISESTRG